MKFKQICPECYYELVIENMKDAVKKCPNCKGREISRQKIIAIDESVDAKNAVSDIPTEENEDEEIVSWAGCIDDNTLMEQEKSSIILRYMQGIIKSDFEIKINSGDSGVILGRNGLGKEYFQYDTRISNEHLYVIYENDTWIIKDRHSTNGTMINEKIIQPDAEYEVKDGDIVTLGKSNNSVKLEVKINAGG